VTTVLLIISVKMLVVCLHWPALMSRLGAGVVWLANAIGRRLGRRPDEGAIVIPEARVVQRPR
jgi:hypothetical protein